MLLQIVAIVASAFAALFAYLSWRDSVLTDAYKREEHLRNRLADPPLGFVTDHYFIQVYRIRSKEREGWLYGLKKYSPIGVVEGQTQVTLLFNFGEGLGRTIFDHEGYAEYLEDIGITYLHSTDTGEIIGGEDSSSTLTLIIDSIDPMDVEDILTQYRVALTDFHDSEGEGRQEQEAARETE